MFKVLMLTVLSLVITTVPVMSQSVVLPSGTVLNATNNSKIDTSALKVGNDVNFKLSMDVAGSGVTFAKGTELMGRVIEVEPFSADSKEAHLVVMFDFLRVEDEFYSVSAVVVTCSAGADTIVKSSEVFEGGSLISRKGSDVSISDGTAFTIKLTKEITKE